MSSLEGDGIGDRENLDARNLGDHQERQDLSDIETPRASSANYSSNRGLGSDNTGESVLSDRTRNDPAYDQSGYSGSARGSNVGLRAPGSAADPAHDPSGTNLSTHLGGSTGITGSSENNGHGTVAPQSATETHGIGTGAGYPAVGTEQSGTGIQPGAYSDTGVRGGGIGTTNETGSIPTQGVSGSALNTGAEFTGHRSAEEIAGEVAAREAESSRGVPPPEAGWHPTGRAAADGSESRGDGRGYGTDVGADAAGLGAGAVAASGTEYTSERAESSTTLKEQRDPTDSATEKLERDPAQSAHNDAVLGSDATGPDSARGERGTSSDDAGDSTVKEREDPTDSATSKLERDPAQSAGDDSVLGSDAQGQSSGRGEEVDPEKKEEVKHETPANPNDDPYWHGKETAKEHLEHEAREGRSVKENTDAIPTAGGEKLGSKHWGESKMIKE